ncbi:hypothetical protein NitYY0814_C0363 [Nitratiruptor sp. YY08-14]|nr:hypothetical protein NitYY0810_C0363 [Nitratiruptor sp. YY08-10]BCD63536.1 hypothetical protein NitYY0814_C0363 [Nitratiruptor sp. YY08-14]BCD83088.1 hypothetical protein NrS2_38 [Nitratiruptor phage NrS-2]BCD83154.1 hypothetical protein NrS3_38 [Nitratiruptor phage NrS-3]
METIRTTIKSELINSYKRVLGYKPSTPLVNMILRGDRKPNPEVRFDLHQRGVIPFSAWLDIKSYLNHNSKECTNTNTSKGEKVL